MGAELTGEPKRRVVNIDENPRNADWVKTSLDLPGVNDVESLRAHLHAIGMSPEQFKTLPVYALNVDRAEMSWLRDL